MQKFETEQIEQRLADFSDWSMTGQKIQRTFSFDDFVGAMEFVNQVAGLAERLQHHPDIMIRYSKVTLTLSTHDAGGVTEKDFGFAREVDLIVGVQSGA